MEIVILIQEVVRYLHVNGHIALRAGFARAVAVSSERKTAATIRDVSEHAGVSHMTVSRVLSGSDQVLPATRKRVEQAIVALNYLPDRTAGALATRRTGFVGLVLPALTNANFAAVAQGLTELLRPAGFELLIGYTSYSMAEEERQVRTMLARRPEALVLTGAPLSRSAADLLSLLDIPTVHIASLTAESPAWSVGLSNYKVGCAAARHLLALGHRRIGALGSSFTDDLRDSRGDERLVGFAATLKAAGVDTDLVLRYGEPPVSFDHGASAMAVLLERAPDVEAVFAVSDLSAVGAMMECRRRGVDVPAQVSIIGFGDFDIGRQVVPALTTLAVDFTAMGRRTGALIRSLLRGETPAERTVDVGFSLLQRQSCAPRMKR